MINKQPYLADFVDIVALDSEDTPKNYLKLQYKNIARDLNAYWKKSDRFKPLTIKNSQYFCRTLFAMERCTIFKVNFWETKN